MRKLSFSLCLFSVIICACHKTNVTSTPVAPTSATKSDKDTLHGYATLYDEGGTQINGSGMTISIENSNPLVSTTTNSSGEFFIPVDTTLQSFALVYLKAGVGTFKRYFVRNSDGSLSALDFNGLKFPASNIAEDLGLKSTVSVSRFNVVIIGDTLQIRVNISSPTPGEKYIRMVYQKDLSNISFATVDKSGLYWSHKFPVVNGDNVLNICVSCSAACNTWKSGDKILHSIRRFIL